MSEHRHRRSAGSPSRRDTRQALRRAATCESLEVRRLFAFGITANATNYVVDTGGGVVFTVLNNGTASSSTIHRGDLSSFKLNSVEFAAPYATSSRYSHFESGLSGSAQISYTIDPAGTPQWILITCDDTTATAGAGGTGVIQYYVAKRNDPNIYMATYAPEMKVSSTRYIAYLDGTKFTNRPAESDNSGGTGGIETGDVQGHADGTTSSKYYGETRNIDHLYHGASGASSGAFMFIGNREAGAGGPFWKDIDFQSGSSVEIYNMPYSGHSLTDSFRPGLHGPYALVLTNGTPPTSVPDYSFMDTLPITGMVPASGRGTLSGRATGVTAGHVVTVGLSNTAAQYWTNPDASGNYTISGIKPGTYTETIYDEELAVGVRTVVITAGQTTRADITATAIYGLRGSNNTFTAFSNSATPIWRIGEWDGTPREFLNGDKITVMHPQDVRLNQWADSSGMTNFTIGTSLTSQWPMAEWKTQVGSAPYVDNKNRITFTLNSTQRSQDLTLRIGITRSDSERPGVSANGGTTQYGVILSQPDARGVSLGNWRGNNGVYTYNFAANSLNVGVNTFDIYAISGSTFTGYFAGYHIYDAVDLVPTSSTFAPAVATLAVSPGTGTNVSINGTRKFFATARDSGSVVIPANVTWTTTNGTINDAGEYTAPATTGTATITATYGAVTNSITINVVATAPTVATPASALPNPTLNKATVLSVLGADDLGEAALTYTWAINGTQPGTVTFGATNGTNAGKSLSATFSAYGTYNLQVTITDASGNTTVSYTSVSVQNEKTWYKFDQPNGSGLTDYSGNTDFGSVYGNFSTVTGVNSGALKLAGAAATLPSGVVAGLTDFTIATWVKPDSIASWMRIFDFGTSTSNYMFLTAQAAAAGNPIRFGIKTGGVEQTVNGPALTAGVWTHIAITLSGTTATLYVNGVSAGTNASMTINPAALGVTTLNFLGESQFSADPAYLGSIDDFRIYGRALNSTEVGTLADRPTVAIAAAASPATVTATTSVLSVLGADALYGEAGLTYTWTRVGQFGGSVSFSANGTNASKTTTATFTAAGSYDFVVTIRNTNGNSVTSNVTVVVNQTYTGVSVTPTPTTVVSRGTRQFTASANDQFGDPMASQPAFTWTKTSGTGSIDSTGLYTAPIAAGTAVVTATSGAFSGTASITITNAAPTVVTPTSATPNPVTGTSTDISVLGDDIDGTEPFLIYTWSSAGPAPVAFSFNGNNWAKDATAFFMKAGTYTITCTISDGALSTTSATSVIVSATFSALAVTPDGTTLKSGQTRQYAATAYDQFGETMTAPALTWSVTGVGSVNTTGLYTASAAGAANVFATSGSISGSASVLTTSSAPTIATATTAATSTVIGSSVAVSVLGADDGGEGNLIYSWSVASGPASVAFSANNSNASKNSTALFHAAGVYVLSATITDTNGNFVKSNVTVTVSQTATKLTLTPATASVATSTTKQFTATARDQFGNLIASPAITWSIASGAGSVSGTGLFTAPAVAGKSTIRATLGALTANSVATIYSWSPYSLAVKSTSSTTLAVSFRDSATIETGFQLQIGTRQSNGLISWTTIYTIGSSAGSGGTVNYTIPTTFTPGTRYFRVRATNATSSSNWSNTATKTL